MFLILISCNNSILPGKFCFTDKRLCVMFQPIHATLKYCLGLIWWHCFPIQDHGEQLSATTSLGFRCWFLSDRPVQDSRELTWPTRCPFFPSQCGSGCSGPRISSSRGILKHIAGTDHLFSKQMLTL